MIDINKMSIRYDILFYMTFLTRAENSDANKRRVGKNENGKNSVRGDELCLSESAYIYCIPRHRKWIYPRMCDFGYVWLSNGTLRKHYLFYLTSILERISPPNLF